MMAGMLRWAGLGGHSGSRLGVSGGWLGDDFRSEIIGVHVVLVLFSGILGVVWCRDAYLTCLGAKSCEVSIPHKSVLIQRCWRSLQLF